MKLLKYFLLITTSCSTFIVGCSLFDSNSSSSRYSGTGSNNLCEEGQTLKTVGGVQTCISDDLIGSTCTTNSDCGSSEYCNTDTAPYVCTAQPCMLDSDCPQNDPVWGAMVCNKTSVPNRCVDANGDGCVVTTTNGQTTSDCGIAQYCDNLHGHPYSCKPQACTGDAICQKCDSGMTCNTVNGYKINTRPNSSTYEYVCDLAPYVHICKVQELTPPPSGGCTSDADCTASALGHKCLAGAAPRKCGCNAATNCSSGQFCRASTNACQLPAQNECTVGTGPHSAATCTAGQQFQTWDNCDDIYFGCDQYFCDNYTDTAHTICRIRIYANQSGGSVCTKQYQCFSGWCYYSGNTDPTANPPYPPTTGYCRDKKSDGTLGLIRHEHCTNTNQCTGQTGLICDSTGFCLSNYGQACGVAADCKTPGVCHTTCYQSNLALGASCTYTDQCQTGATCSGGICKGNNGTGGCNGNNNLCVNGLCHNQAYAVPAGYYCVGNIDDACTVPVSPPCSPGYSCHEGSSTECMTGFCTREGTGTPLKCGLAFGLRCDYPSYMPQWCWKSNNGQGYCKAYGSGSQLNYKCSYYH